MCITYIYIYTYIMNNQNCNIKENIERNNIKLDIYNKFMDELITNFHLLNLKFFNSSGT